MVFNLQRETKLLREEVFEQLPHSPQEKRQYLLRARDILWQINTDLAFGEKDRNKLLSLFKEALELLFCAYSFEKIQENDTQM